MLPNIVTETSQRIIISITSRHAIQSKSVNLYKNEKRDWFDWMDCRLVIDIIILCDVSVTIFGNIYCIARVVNTIANIP